MRHKLAARLWRAAERQAQKLEFSLAWSFQRKEDRAADLAALKELTKIMLKLGDFEDAFARAEVRREGREARSATRRRNGSSYGWSFRIVVGQRRGSAMPTDEAHVS